jgi:PhoH-like ATPase
MAARKKIYVLDTNVILHDYRSIYSFEEHDVVIPITVLEELDKFKRGDNLINFQAREFTRELDSIAGDDLFTKGVKLGNGRGRLFIETGKEFSEEMKKSFSENIPDHRILAITDYLKKTKKGRQVKLVSKDINLRMKAKSLGIVAEDYRRDQIRDIDHTVERNVSVVDNVNDELIAKIYENPQGVLASEFDFLQETKGNQFYILKGEKSSVIATYDPFTMDLRKVEKLNTYGIFPKNAEQAFAFDALLNPEISLVALSGKAGTGKTLLALAAALQQHNRYEQIFLARPIVALSNRDLGYLPGDASEKISPYMQPLFDNLGFIKHRFNPHSKENILIDELLKDERLVITPLAYIRGRSLSNAYFIVDEAQNLTPHEVKTIITRAGEGTKMIFTGDIEQIDSPYLDKKSNGLAHLFDRMYGQDIFAHVHLKKGERSFLAELASDLL